MTNKNILKKEITQTNVILHTEKQQLEVDLKLFEKIKNAESYCVHNYVLKLMCKIENTKILIGELEKHLEKVNDTNVSKVYQVKIHRNRNSFIK